MVEWYRRYFLPSPHHRRLTVKVSRRGCGLEGCYSDGVLLVNHQVISHHTAAMLDAGNRVLESSVDGPIPIQLKEGDVEAFKQQCPLFPGLYEKRGGI